MTSLKEYYPIIATAIFVATIVLAHILSTPNYDWTKNTISDLGAQKYKWRFIMQFGFIVFGILLSAGILSNSLTWRTAPILIYAIGVGLSGIFCTKPFFPTDAYSEIQATIHSACAQFAGIAFTIGVLIQLFYTDNPQEKNIHFTFFILVIAFSASFGLMKNYQGVFQRLLYLVSFIWLVKFYTP